MASELLWVPPLLAGKTIADVGDQFDGDVLVDDPVGTLTAAASAAAAADGPAARAASVHLSSCDAPGAEYLGQITTDLIIHRWDVSHGTGLDDHLDDELVAAVYGYLAPQAEMWRSGGALGPAVEVGSDASLQDRLIALTGRQP